LTVGSEVLADLGIGDLPIAAIAKGPDRDAGRERIFLPGRPSFMLQPRDPALYFLQRLRDEAHRFAIGTHRAGRSKARLRSALDEVPGIGARRKKACCCTSAPPRRWPAPASPTSKPWKASPGPWPAGSTTISTATADRAASRAHFTRRSRARCPWVASGGYATRGTETGRPRHRRRAALQEEEPGAC
jgi:hypothetical protein